MPVFGATLKAHFDASGRLTVVNGAVIPDIDVSVTPSRSAQEAEATAVSHLKRKGMSASQSRLLVYREGLAKGVPGANHLAYEVVVTNKRVREFIYVDAHTGKFIDRISGTPDALESARLRCPEPDGAGTQLSSNPFWVEGRPVPDRRASKPNNMIVGLGRDLRPLLQRIRPRLLRRRGRDDGFDLQSRQRLPERVVERRVHLVLPGHDQR